MASIVQMTGRFGVLSLPEEREMLEMIKAEEVKSTQKSAHPNTNDRIPLNSEMFESSRFERCPGLFGRIRYTFNPIERFASLQDGGSTASLIGTLTNMI
jgi:hypothetical protein